MLGLALIVNPDNKDGFESPEESLLELILFKFLVIVSVFHLLMPETPKWNIPQCRTISYWF